MLECVPRTRRLQSCLIMRLLLCSMWGDPPWALRQLCAGATLTVVEAAELSGSRAGSGMLGRCLDGVAQTRSRLTCQAIGPLYLRLDLSPAISWDLQSVALPRCFLTVTRGHLGPQVPPVLEGCHKVARP